MAKLLIEITPEKLAELLRDLPADQLKIVLAKVADRLEVRDWMRLGESGFQEWLTEPDLSPRPNSDRRSSWPPTEMTSRFSGSSPARRNHLNEPGSC